MEAETRPTAPKPVSQLKSFFALIRKSKEAIVGLALVAVYFATAIAVEVASLLNVRITPYNPIQQNVGSALSPPSFTHIFGTDLLGRDVFSRIVAATPNDMAISMVVVLVSLLIGISVGSVAGLRGGLLDELLMRFTDVIFALPALLIAIVIAVALGPSVVNMMIALTAVWWPPYARLARGEALRVAHQNYIEAARSSGMGLWKTMIKHVVPNISVTMLVYTTLDAGTVILAYAGLSYLGLSVRPPFPDWGYMVSSFQDYLISEPWLPLIPGLVIALVVVGFSFLGDGIRDALEE